MVYHMMYLLEAVSSIYLHYIIDILSYGLSYDVFIRNCFPHMFTLYNRYFKLWSINRCLY
jgi:hypothetical protein